MSFIDTINPWGVIARLRAENEELRARLGRVSDEVCSRNVQLDNLHQDLSIRRMTLVAREITITRLENLLKQCHYRDPATGRIGKIGEMPQ